MAGLVAPEIPPTQNPIAPAISAFIAMSQVANKRRALEDQLQKMEMANSLAEHRLQMQGLNYESLNNLRLAEAAKADAERTNLVNKAQGAIDAANDQKVWDVGLAEMTSKPGSKNYLADLSILRKQAQRFLMTPDGKRAYAEAIDAHKQAAKEIVDSHVGITKAYEGFLKDDKLNGRWLENPEQWDYVDDSGKSTPNAAKATRRVLKLDANLQPLPPDSKDHAYTRTLPAQRFDQILKLKGANDQIAQDVATGADEPDMRSAVSQAVQESAPKIGSIPVVATDADYGKIAPGGYYVDPNGKTRQKPAQ